MRWVVTGGLGFIGSHFIRLALQERSDLEVVNLDAMTYAGNPANLSDLEQTPRYRFLRGDICDSAAVREAIGSRADAVVNFAAETHVDRSIDNPEAFLRTDTLGTQVLLEALRDGCVSRMVQVSTDEVYGEVAEGESTESDALRPRSPYAASKAAADLLALAYHATYGLPVDRRVPVYGDGLQIRNWLYVDDHARAVLHVLEHGVPGGIYNAGGGSSLTNLELTRLLIGACGRSLGRHVEHVADRLGHDRRYALDSSRLHALGWKPQMRFEEGIAGTVAWYRANEAWWRPLKGEHAPA